MELYHKRRTPETLRMRDGFVETVPDEVGVLGTDNDPRRYQLSPHPISSVDTDLFAVGYRAAALLERIMNGEAVAAGRRARRRPSSMPETPGCAVGLRQA